MIRPSALGDETAPDLSGPIIGIADTLERFSRLLRNVKMGMIATILINRKIHTVGLSAKRPNSVKTGITVKDRRNELFASYGTIVFTTKDGTTVKVVIIITLGSFQLDPVFPV
jgi:hypothetical protein